MTKYQELGGADAVNWMKESSIEKVALANANILYYESLIEDRLSFPPSLIVFPLIYPFISELVSQVKAKNPELLSEDNRKNLFEAWIGGFVEKVKSEFEDFSTKWRNNL